MSDFHKAYYATEGPFGVPMKDRQAQALEALLRTLPKERPYEPQTAVIAKSPTELLTGERADVSWISEESIDRQGDIVIAAGMDDVNFRLNPVVTLQHAYWLPPVGRSLWRRRERDGDRAGVKAKTVYPARPESWPDAASWPPDFAFPLVQAGLLCGKSIGFLPTKVRTPTEEEIARRPELKQVARIVEEWLLLEYACVYMPAQQNAVVEAVSKSMPLPDDVRRALNLPDLPEPMTLPFTPLGEIEKHIRRRF